MATLFFDGPYTWIRPHGENAFMPGEEHVWFAGPFTHGTLTFQLSAHPSVDQTIQQLAVLSLSITYELTGGPVINFVVRNVGPTAVFSYRVFVSGVKS